MLQRAAVVFAVVVPPLIGGHQVGAQVAAVAVTGVAYDSLNRAPLAGAVVTIVGTTQTTKADARGRFRFDSVPPGSHTFAAQHAALDSLGFTGISARATVTDGREEIRLGSPSFATLWVRACGGVKPPADSGFVYGSVRDAATGAAAPGATVDVTWIDLGVTKANRITEKRWHGQSATNAAGDFAICGVPTDVGLRIRAVTDSAASGLIDLPGRGARVQRRDLVLGIVADSLGPRSSGIIVGAVTDTAGRPVANARVIADGVPELRADSSGRFMVRGVPLGTRQVELLAIGMSPVVTVVDVTLTDTANVFATMRRITTLDVVRVTASPYVRRLVRDLDERRKLGMGYVRDSAAIAQHGTLFSVFFEVPNVRAERTGVGNDFIITLPVGGGHCVANLVIDGRRADYDELSFLRPPDVAAVEVYPRRMSAPMQFIRDDNCGVVVVWTKWAFAG